MEDKYKEKLASKGVKVKKTEGETMEEEGSDSDTGSESDVIEDEDGELITPGVEAQILKTLAEIRAKDEKIYDPKANFFSPVELQKAEAEWCEKKKQAKKERPIKLKDYHRERLLKANHNDEEEEGESDEEGLKIKTHEEEQEELLSAFKAAADEADDDDSNNNDDLLRMRPRTEEELVKEEEDYKNFLLENLAGSENAKECMSEWFSGASGRGKDANNEEQFLIDYILSRGWIEKDRKTLPSYEQIIAEDEEDEEAVEKMEEFEEKYNFRFEQPGGDQIVTYSRHVDGSMRREDNKRKEQRAARKMKKEEEKSKQQEELKRLKNLKKQEIQEKLKKIQDISGNDRVLDEGIDLESDFDSDAHDRKMSKLFDDNYYGDELDGGKKPEWSDTDKEEDQSGDGNEIQQKVIRKATKSISKLVKKTPDAKQLGEYLDEYYQLDYEDMIAGEIPCRFKYQRVKPTTFGLKVRDILRADDADLNTHVSLKKLAPYRPTEVVEVDEIKYGSKKRICKFYDLLKRGRSGCHQQEPKSRRR